MPAHPSAPRPFRWRREAAPRIQRFAVRRISPLWLGRIVKEGDGPHLDTPAPLPRPAFPATPKRPRGRVSGGGLPSRLPIVPGGFAGGHGAISALYRSPQSRPVRTHRPSRFSNLGTAEIASFQAPDVCEASAECASGAHGARPEKRETTRVVSLFSESGPLPETDARPFPGPAQRASAPIACTSCILPRARSGCSPLRPPRRACGAGWSCACPPCAPRRQSPRPRSP